MNIQTYLTPHQKRSKSIADRRIDVEEFSRRRERMVSLEEICAMVKGEYGVSDKQFQDQHQGRFLKSIEAREAFVWLAMRTTWKSFPETAENIGMKSHAACIAMYKRACWKHKHGFLDSRGLPTNEVLDQMRVELMVEKKP